MSFYIYIYKSSFPCFWLNHIEQTGLNRQKRVRCASELFAVTSSQVMCCPHQAIQGPGFFFQGRLNSSPCHRDVQHPWLHSFNTTRGGVQQQNFPTESASFLKCLSKGRYSGLLTGEWTYRVVFFGSSDTYDCHLICQIKPHLHGFQLNQPSKRNIAWPDENIL